MKHFIVAVIMSGMSLFAFAYAVEEKSETYKPSAPQHDTIIWADTLVLVDGKRALVTLGLHKNGMVSWR